MYVRSRPFPLGGVHAEPTRELAVDWEPLLCCLVRKRGASWRIAGPYRPARWLVGWLVSPISSMSACALAGLKRSLFGSRRSLVFLYSPIGTHAHVGSWRYYVCTYSPFPLAVRLSQGKERNKEARSSDRQRCRVSDSPCCTATQIPRKHLWIRLIHATGAKKLPICAT